MKTALKAAEFWVGVGGAVWKPAKPVSARKLEKQGSSVVSSELCYRVLTGTRARIWVKAPVITLRALKKSRHYLIFVFSK